LFFHFITKRFVIIPCCPFELSGAKFTGEGFNLKNVGRYRCFLERARQLMRDCGYVVEEENLRIPSTKNIALIGRKRTFKEGIYIYIYFMKFIIKY